MSAPTADRPQAALYDLTEPHPLLHLALYAAFAPRQGQPPVPARCGRHPRHRFDHWEEHRVRTGERLSEVLTRGYGCTRCGVGFLLSASGRVAGHRVPTRRWRLLVRHRHDAAAGHRPTGTTYHWHAAHCEHR